MLNVLEDLNNKVLIKSLNIFRLMKFSDFVEKNRLHFTEKLFDFEDQIHYMFTVCQVLSYILKSNNEVCYLFFDFELNIKKICYDLAQICMNEMFKNSKSLIF